MCFNILIFRSIFVFMATPNLDLNILNNWTMPFDATRLEALDQVVDYMYNGNYSQVSKGFKFG